MADYVTWLNRPQEEDKYGKYVSPYLQMAFEYMLKKELGEPELEMKRAEEQRATEKARREAISGVSKGEYPITAIPDYKKMLNRSIDTTGLTGSPENLQAMQSISPTAQISGIPEFMKRVSTETPESAQQRLMQSYAQQQQAISPYKGIQAETLGAKQQINALLENGTPWENIPIQLKIMAGFAAKEGGGFNLNFPSESPALTQEPSQVKPTLRGRIRVKDKKSGQTGTIEENEFDPKLYERI